MKQAILLLVVTFFSIISLAQGVAINETGNAPDNSAQLDISSSTRGVLLPRLTTLEIAAIATPANGLLVYNKTINQVWVNVGTPEEPSWQTISSNSAWSLTGNPATTISNFLGTIDNQPLVFKTNNIFSGMIDPVYNNVFLGLFAGDSTTDAYDNVAIGGYSLYSNTSGSGNVGVGSGALSTNTTGSGNVAVGSGSMTSLDGGWFNTALGGQTLGGTLGDANTAVGWSSLAYNVGQHNTGVGYLSLEANTIGNGNAAVGSYALAGNTEGNSNVAIGSRALFTNTVLSNLVAVGDSALYANDGGLGRNTAVGSKAGFKTITGYDNYFFGYSAGYNSTLGGLNTYLGANTGFSTLDGSTNTAVGFSSMYYNLTGYSNTAVGAWSLESNTSGDDNTGIGKYALQANQTGISNTAVGFSAAQFTVNPASGTFIGDYTGAADDLFNIASIGRAAYATASFQVRIGNDDITSIGGIVNWTNFSDGRFKKNIEENVPGLLFISQLRPVTYTLDVEGIVQAKTASGMRVPKPSERELQGRRAQSQVTYTGFVAQEVETLAKKLGYTFSGVDAPKNGKDFYGLRYAEFVVPLVKAVQEQQSQIEQLKTENESLKKEIELIKKKLGL
jgi:hypothetical protein